MKKINLLTLLVLTVMAPYSNATGGGPLKTQITCIVSFWLSPDSAMADSQPITFMSEAGVQHENLELTDTKGKIWAKANFDYQFIGHDQIVVSASILQNSSKDRVFTIINQIKESYFSKPDQTLFLIANQENKSRSQLFCTN